jgi:hypothetical protein
MAGNAGRWMATRLLLAGCGLLGTGALCLLDGSRSAFAAEPASRPTVSAAVALFDGEVAREAIPGFAAKEHPLPLPTSTTHIAYEQQLFPFIRSRGYATTLGWSHDKRVRDTGAYVKGTYYGTHPAVRCFYLPKVMYWFTGDPDFWPEGRDAGLAPKKQPREGAIPDGGMIIKEMLPPPAARYEGVSEDELLAILRLPTSAGCDVMIKDSSGSPSGWFWASVYPGQEADTEHTFAYPQAGVVLACVRCHSVAEEGGTFSSLRNIAGFAGEPIRFYTDSTWREIPASLQPYNFRHDPDPPSLVAPQAPGPARPNFAFLHTFASARHVTYPEVEKFPMSAATVRGHVARHIDHQTREFLFPDAAAFDELEQRLQEWQRRLALNSALVGTLLDDTAARMNSPLLASIAQLFRFLTGDSHVSLDAVIDLPVDATPDECLEALRSQVDEAIRAGGLPPDLERYLGNVVATIG